MKSKVIPMGNSKGIRIPKVILEQCRIEKEVILEVVDNSIIIKPVKKKPRENWKQYFRKMKENKEDQLIIDDGKN